MTTKTVLALGALAILTTRGTAGDPEALPRSEQLTRFDPQTSLIQRRDGQWIVEAGELLLKECGRRDQDARAIWHLIKQLELDQHGTIGRPRPLMEYWLSKGKPPRSLPPGLRVLPLRPDRLRVEGSPSGWVLCEQTRVLFNFGADETEARQALAVIKKYGFDCIGVVGQAAPSMLIFAAPGEGTSVESAPPPEPEASPPGAAPRIDPTPLLPPLDQPSQQHQLVNRGRPFRSQRSGEVDRMTANVVTDRRPFDPGQSQVREENGKWVLAVGSLKLANFGQSERSARLAQTAVMHYRLTELVTVGARESTCRYFLASGQAPRGLMTGVTRERFVPERLEVYAVADRQFLAQGSHPIFDCGTRIEDAHYMLGLVRRLGLDYVVRIGQTDAESMTILVRSY